MLVQLVHFVLSLTINLYNRRRDKGQRGHMHLFSETKAKGLFSKMCSPPLEKYFLRQCLCVAYITMKSCAMMVNVPVFMYTHILPVETFCPNFYLFTALS